MPEPLWILRTAEDVTESILSEVADCVEGWYTDRPLSTEDFIDTLCTRHGNVNVNPWDIEQLATPAVRKIMRHARAVKREIA